MNKWLDGITYHIDLQWWMLTIPGGFAILIDLMTVSSQSIKASWKTSVDSLMDE